jgi:iron complex outermembrane receptor protein
MKPNHANEEDKLEGTYSDQADGFDPNASALVSWKNGEESLGLMLSGIYQ